MDLSRDGFARVLLERWFNVVSRFDIAVADGGGVYANFWSLFLRVVCLSQGCCPYSRLSGTFFRDLSRPLQMQWLHNNFGGCRFLLILEAHHLPNDATRLWDRAFSLRPCMFHRARIPIISNLLFVHRTFRDVLALSAISFAIGGLEAVRKLASVYRTRQQVRCRYDQE